MNDHIDIPAAEITLRIHTKKTYHSPFLFDWGNLQELTKGSGGDYVDGDFTASSNISGQRFRPRPDPNNPNLPFDPNYIGPMPPPPP